MKQLSLILILLAGSGTLQGMEILTDIVDPLLHETYLQSSLNLPSVAYGSRLHQNYPAFANLCAESFDEEVSYPAVTYGYGEQAVEHDSWQPGEHGQDETEMKPDNSTIDYSKLSPVTLLQIYHHFSQILNYDVAQYIFSHQAVLTIINENIDLFDATNKRRKAESLRSYMERKLDQYGYCYTLELLTRNLTRRGISICDFKNDEDNMTVLHANFDTTSTRLFLQVAGNDTWKLLNAQDTSKSTALHYAAMYNEIEIIKLLLKAAGDPTLLTCASDLQQESELRRAGNVWSLLAKQDCASCTALHWVGEYGYDYTESIKLLLDAAGNQAQDLINIPNKEGKTAFGLVDSKAKNIMREYMQK